MSTNIKFLHVKFRAIAQATESEDKVRKAIVFTSGSEEVSSTSMRGHFGNSIVVFEVELTRSRDIRRFLETVEEWGLKDKLKDNAEQRLDEDCVFHFRLDKQKAFLEEIALAGSGDVIDVRMKVGVYPARYEEAVKAVSAWISDGK